MKNALKHNTFASIFESVNIAIEPIIPDKQFIIVGHGTSGSHWNQSIELNTKFRELKLMETMHIRKHIGPFETTSRNYGRYGDCMVIKYNTKNTKL